MSKPTLNLSAFGRVRFVNPDGTLTREAVLALQTVQQIIGGATGVIFASTIENVPAGGIAATDVQTAINELDGEKQPKDPTLTGLAALAVIANKVPYGTGSDVFGLLTLDPDGTLAANSDTNLATQKAVKTYADNLIAAQDAMVFKGVIDCSANPNYPAADRGHTYRASVAGKIGGAFGVVVEVGDLMLCLTDGTPSGNQATVGANWTTIQTNIDGAVIGPVSAVDGHVALFNGATGKIIKDSGLTLSGTNTGDQTITLTGDATGTGTGSFAVAVSKINGVSFAGLATGLLKNTTTTGVPSIAAAGTDYVAPGGALGTPASGTLTNCTGLPVGGGGTGITSFAWSAYTPTASAGSGGFTTLGTLTGRYFTIGKIVFFSASIPITTNGTAAGYVQVALPPLTVGATDYYGAGRANVSGKGLSVRMVTAQQFAEVRNYDGTYPGASGETLEISGWYELA